MPHRNRMHFKKLLKILRIAQIIAVIILSILLVHAMKLLYHLLYGGAS